MKLDFFFFFRCTRINYAFQFHSRMHLVIICIYLFCNPFRVLKTEFYIFLSLIRINEYSTGRKENFIYGSTKWWHALKSRWYSRSSCGLWVKVYKAQSALMFVCLFLIHEGKYIIPRMWYFTYVLLKTGVKWVLYSKCEGQSVLQTAFSLWLGRETTVRCKRKKNKEQKGGSGYLWYSRGSHGSRWF